MNERRKKMFAIILMMFVRYKMLLKPPPPCFFRDTDDFGFVILLNLFYQYSKQRKRPLPFYNMTIRNKIIENWEHENYVINDVYSLIIRRPYDFWMLTGENPNSFHNLVGLVAGNMTGHGNKILSVNNRILMTLIWLRQYPTYAILSLNFRLSVSTISHIIRHTWIKLWEVFSSIVVWPTPEECLDKRGKWHEMPNVVGMIDGTSHEILVPMNEPQQDFYSGHRKYHIHTQVIADNDKNICFVHSGFLGHDNDANSYHQIRPIGPNLPLNFPLNCYILADSIYPNNYPLITPYKSTDIRNQQRPERRRRRKLNALHRKRREYIEHVIKEIKTFRAIGSLNIYRHSRWHMSF